MIVVCGLALYGVSEMALLAAPRWSARCCRCGQRTMATVGVVLAGVPLVAATVHAPATLREPGRVLP